MPVARRCLSSPIEGGGTPVALIHRMAMMWDARADLMLESETTPDIAWKLKFAQLLAASGFESAVIKEAIVLSDSTLRTPVVAESFADAA